MDAEKKLERLSELLSSYDRLAVAFSGGVDSTFLVKTAHDVLGDRLLALTADSVFFPRAELAEAEDFCRQFGIRHMIVRIDALSDPLVRSNPADRCYHCKSALFRRMLDTATAQGFPVLAEGSNTDDVGDYRPGMRALQELGILSPLREAGLSKAEIRELSRGMGLDVWDKPSMACLASRIAYGEALDADKLHAVEEAEALIRSLGVRQCRVRVHGRIARIEVPPQDYSILTERCSSLTEKLKSLGFQYVTLDLEGFRSGSMNEILKK